MSGRLTVEAAVVLRERLLIDDAARLVFVEYLDLHAELTQFAAELNEDALTDLSTSSESGRFESFAQPRARRGIEWSVALSVVALAVVMGVGLAVLWPHGGLPPVTVAGPLAGHFEELSDVVWTRARADHDAAVHSGDRLQVLRGQFLLRLVNGVTAACVAPVDLEIRSINELFVHHGDVCVSVPKQARGFRVDTRTMNVIDLGTVFGVHAEVDGTSEAHVLEGRVVARSGDVDFQEILAGFALAAKGEGGAAAVIPASTEMFEVPLSSLAGIRATSGGIQTLLTPPRSVRAKGLVTAATIPVFLERARVIVAGEIEAYAATPGIYDEKHLPELAELDVPMALTSYYLNAQNSLETPAEGSITFDRPIVGLCLTYKQFDATDADFGHPSVSYPDPGMRGRGTIVGEVTDEVEISPDRRTLRVRMGCSKGSFDQIRVLVDAISKSRGR